jgi:biopolymer transport protein ExbD
MASSRSRLRTSDEAEVNMTPMLDVVFIMLIFFIVTASFVKEAGVDVSRPNAETAEQQSRGNILIAIRPNGEIWVDRRSVDVRSLRANVERLRAENPEGTVVIMADKESQTGLLVEVMDQVRLAGVSNVAIAAEQSAGG